MITHTTQKLSHTEKSYQPFTNGSNPIPGGLSDDQGSIESAKTRLWAGALEAFTVPFLQSPYLKRIYFVEQIFKRKSEERELGDFLYKFINGAEKFLFSRELTEIEKSALKLDLEIYISDCIQNNEIPLIPHKIAKTANLLNLPFHSELVEKSPHLNEIAILYASGVVFIEHFESFWESNEELATDLLNTVFSYVTTKRDFKACLQKDVGDGERLRRTFHQELFVRIYDLVSEMDAETFENSRPFIFIILPKSTLKGMGISFQDTFGELILKMRKGLKELDQFTFDIEDENNIYLDRAPSSLQTLFLSHFMEVWKELFFIRDLSPEELGTLLNELQIYTKECLDNNSIPSHIFTQLVDTAQVLNIQVAKNYLQSSSFFNVIALLSLLGEDFIKKINKLYLAYPDVVKDVFDGFGKKSYLHWTIPGTSPALVSFLQQEIYEDVYEKILELSTTKHDRYLEQLKNFTLGYFPKPVIKGLNLWERDSSERFFEKMKKGSPTIPNFRFEDLK